jgi:hypothetical protein
MGARSANTKKNRTRRVQRGGNQASKTLVFYHIYCNEKTHDIVKSQIVNIVFSGLYRRVDAINCFLVGTQKNINEVEALLKSSGSKFHIAAKGPNDTSYERFTLLKIKDYIQPQDKFLYIHSKGVSKEKSDNIFWWKAYMEYFLMTKADECLKKLDTHDTVGVHWLVGAYNHDYQVPPHYSGNFWWTKGSYFMKLPSTIESRYTDPESYIGKANPKHYEMDTLVNKPAGNFYNNAITPKYYVDL